MHHTLDSTDRIELYLDGISGEEFQSDPLLQDGVVRRLEIIGEATNRVSERTRNRQPDVPWRDIAGMRDKRIHESFGVNLMTVWETAHEGMDQRPAVDASMAEPISNHATRGAH